LLPQDFRQRVRLMGLWPRRHQHAGGYESEQTSRRAGARIGAEQSYAGERTQQQNGKQRFLGREVSELRCDDAAGQGCQRRNQRVFYPTRPLF
jgi:hypothetical protein